MKKLAAVSGIAHLPQIPFMTTGASFAGGHAASAANQYAERCIATAPVIIGMAGASTDDPKVLNVPHMHIYGSIDGIHGKAGLEAAPVLRKKNARWGQAPMWFVAHRQHKANALIYPYFFDLLQARLPADVDPSAGPVELNALKEEDGYLGIIDSWTSNFPEAVPFAKAKVNMKTVWLPNAHTARVWQSFVSNNPRTIIHFPGFEGTSSFGGEPPHGYHISNLEAGVPFEVVASGPLGADIKVEWFAGLKPLKVIKQHGSPHRVTLESLPAGLQAIHAITKLADVTQEISRPVTVMFHVRR